MAGMPFAAPLRRARILLVLAAGMLAAAVLAPPASAHDVLVDSIPAQHDLLEESPQQVVLTFNNEPLDVGSALSVVDADGTEVVVAEGEVEGNDVRLDIDETLPAGDYTVVWRVASSDGHPIDGEIPFTVSTPDAETPTAQQPPAAGDAEAAAADDAPAAESTSPATSGTGLGSLPMWAKVVIAIAATASVAGLIVITARRLRHDR